MVSRANGLFGGIKVNTELQKNKLYAYFTITGSFDPSDITQIVGISPTESWQQGDLNPINQRERKFSRWSLYSRLDQEQELEAHLRDVLSQIDSNREGFRKAKYMVGV